ncbi:hypothetical protein CGRA01v4_09630 [Colletotrichum graminicola]|nr:hypothetical protein CGRA01v4_09630 [Colletotrichum graminicola]
MKILASTAVQKKTCLHAGFSRHQDPSTRPRPNGLADSQNRQTHKHTDWQVCRPAIQQALGNMSGGWVGVSLPASSTNHTSKFSPSKGGGAQAQFQLGADLFRSTDTTILYDVSVCIRHGATGRKVPHSPRSHDEASSSGGGGGGEACRKGKM